MRTKRMAPSRRSSYFGYDEPNYSYAPNGKKLLTELVALSPTPVYVRVHNLLTSGDGSSSLKWGSTNAYTEDSAGKPVYSWAILDQIFDAFHSTGVKPLVEIGFMPEALSTHSQPYRHNFPNGDIYTGWAYPPNDYHKWSELVFQFVRHLRERYGEAEVKTWLWEVWNEPDIGYWKGTPEEYFRLYDFSVDAVLRALPDAHIGGPDSTGPANPKAAEFLHIFLEHCAHQKNYATGKTGSHLDFISFHPKGSPKWVGDHVQMGIARQLNAIEGGFRIVASFPEWRNTPIILGESDPEGCAACSAKQNLQNSYRNGSLYAAYTTERGFWGGRTGPNPTDRAQLGSKRHLICDGRGVPLAIQLTGANRNDSQQALTLVDAIPFLQGQRGCPRHRPDCVLGDRGYDAEAIRRGLRVRRIVPRLAKRNTNRGSGLGRWRWVVERSFAWLNQFRRLRVRYEKRADIHEGLALA